MKKRWVGWILCVGMAAAVCGCGGGFHNPVRGETLIMATNAYAEPYAYYEGQEIVGIDVEVAQAIADKLGMELQIKDVEFDAILNTVNSGKAHIGMSGIIVTEDRLKRADFSDPYIRLTQAVIVRENSEAAGVDDIRDGIIGVPAGAASEIVAFSLEDALVREYDDSADAVQALVNGALDAVIMGREQAEEYVSDAEDLRILEERFDVRGYGIAVAKGNEELLDDVDKALDAIIADGTVYGIVNKYLVAE